MNNFIRTKKEDFYFTKYYNSGYKKRSLFHEKNN